MSEGEFKGIGDLVDTVSHVAVVVSDIGRSLDFYANIMGFQQIQRPNFDRHGAWLSMNNIHLHLIKGKPAVHEDDDLIVSHISIVIKNMDKLHQRLKDLGIVFKHNLNVPSPFDDSGVFDQIFVHDPDGNYLELSEPTNLAKYIEQKMSENETQIHHMADAQAVLASSIRMLRLAEEAKLRIMDMDPVDWPLPKTPDELKALPEANDQKLKNLVARRKVYGDPTQSASEKEIEDLLRVFDNKVPKVIKALADRIKAKGSQTLIPPPFYNTQGTLIQPPPVELKHY